MQSATPGVASDSALVVASDFALAVVPSMPDVAPSMPDAAPSMPGAALDFAPDFAPSVPAPGVS